MKRIKLKKTGDSQGTESNIPLGFEVEATISEEPKVGQRFVCGDFKTGVVLNISGNRLYTKKSEFTFEELPQTKADKFLSDETDLSKRYPKVNNFLDSCPIDESADELSSAINMTKEEIAEFAEKCGRATLVETNPSKILKELIPTMTEKEMMFAMGTFIIESCAKVKSLQRLTGLPDLKELLDKLRRKGRGE